MVRVCPKCGDYYADALLAFCPADGTPLAGVDPSSEVWEEGSRVIEQKGNALKELKRRLKWRRILMRSMTMLVSALVVCVAAANSYIYLRHKREGIEPASPSGPSLSSSLPPTPPPCVEADQDLEREAIIKSFGEKWRQRIEGEREKIIAENTPAGTGNNNALAGLAGVEAALGAIQYKSSFPKACTATLTARYVWEVRQNVNGTIKVVSVAGKKKFACVKTVETWNCP